MLSHKSGVDITRASQIWDESVVDAKMAQLKEWTSPKGFATRDGAAVR